MAGNAAGVEAALLKGGSQSHLDKAWRKKPEVTLGFAQRGAEVGCARVVLDEDPELPCQVIHQHIGSGPAGPASCQCAVCETR